MVITEVYRADTRGDLKSCNKNYCMTTRL